MLDFDVGASKSSFMESDACLFLVHNDCATPLLLESWIYSIYVVPLLCDLMMKENPPYPWRIFGREEDYLKKKKELIKDGKWGKTVYHI